MTNLFIFNTDFRARDNPALFYAAESGESLVAMFIRNPKKWGSHSDSDLKIAFQIRNLKILSKKLTWNGKVISSNGYSFDYDKLNDHEKSVGKLVVYKKPNRGFKYRAEKTEHLKCEKNVVVIKNDLGHSNGMIGRVLPLIIDQGKKVYMITFKGSKAEKGQKDNF